MWFLLHGVEIDGKTHEANGVVTAGKTATDLNMFATVVCGIRLSGAMNVVTCGG